MPIARNALSLTSTRVLTRWPLHDPSNKPSSQKRQVDEGREEGRKDEGEGKKSVRAVTRFRARFAPALRENTRALAHSLLLFPPLSFLLFFLLPSFYFYEAAQSANPKGTNYFQIFARSCPPPRSTLPALSQTASGARPTLFMKFHFRYIMQSTSLSLLLRFIRYYGYYVFFSSKILHAPEVRALLRPPSLERGRNYSNPPD